MIAIAVRSENRDRLAPFLAAVYRLKRAHIYSTVATAAAPNAGAAVPIAGGIATMALLASQGKASKTAKAFVDNFQNPFLKNVLEPAAELAKTDPAASRAMVEQGWQQFLSDTNEVVNRVDPRFRQDTIKVLQQAFTTPAFMQTVSGLLGKNPLSPEYTSTFTQQSAANPSQWSLGNLLTQIAPAALQSTIGRGTGDNTNIPNPETYPGITPPILTLPGGLETQAPPIASPGKAPARTGIGGIVDSIISKKGIPDLISGGTSIISGILNSRAARNAAELQANAANRAAELESEAAKNSLDFVKEVYGDQKTANAPFLAAGQNALAEVQKLIGAGGELSKDFTAPTGEEVRATPGYQFKLDEAMKALGRRTHGLVSGPAMKAAERYAEDYADTNYDAATNRALNIFQTNRSNRLNPLLTIAGYGPQAVASNNQSGTNAANANTNILTGTAQDVGALGQNAAFQTASGNVGSTNALTAVLQQLSNLAQQRRASGYSV